MGDKPHGWAFAGTVAALATREHPARAKLILLFETLESENSAELQRRVGQLLSELSSCPSR
jgi:hypothetical protein